MIETFELEGIGTHWWFTVYDLSQEQVGEVKKETESLLVDFERAYSRFKAESLIGILNTTKSLEHFPRELYDMLYLCEELKKVSDGNFTALSGLMQENNGYDAGYSFESKGLPIARNPSFTTLTMDRIEIPDNAKVDLGGIGKGWLIEKFKLLFLSKGVQHYVINGGGDMQIRTELPETLYLENPFSMDEAIGEIQIHEGAIACSSPSKRNWKDKKTGTLKHHLISGHTGESVSEKAAVFTSAASAVLADLASTAMFVSPIDVAPKIAEFLECHYLIVFADGTFVRSEGYPGVLYT